MYRYDRKVLKCRNASRSAGRRCWNRVQVNTGFATRVLLGRLFKQLCDQDGFVSAMQSAAHTEFTRSRALKRKRELPDADRIEDLQRQSANLTEAIAEGGQIVQLVDRLNQVTEEIQQLRTRSAVQQQSAEDAVIAVAKRIDKEPLQVLRETAAASFEFADLMRTACPVFDIVPVQALDTPQIRPMARLSLELISDSGTTHRIEVEERLFEPPLHIRHREQCFRLKQGFPRESLKKIAGRSGLNHMTVKRAIDYSRRMSEAETKCPYRVLTSQPVAASRWKNRTESST